MQRHIMQSCLMQKFVGQYSNCSNLHSVCSCSNGSGCPVYAGNLLATTSGDLVYLDFGMMSEAPQGARYAIIAHVVHLVNRDYQAMCRDYYKLEFMDPSVDTSPIAPALAEFFDDALGASVSQLNFRAIVDGLGSVLFQYPFR